MLQTGKPGQFEYNTIDTRSISGMKEAEQLQAQGWAIISTGFTTIQLERLKSSKKYIQSY